MALCVAIFSYSFLERDFFHLRTVAYQEKAILALEGSPPRLENVGFVYPPAPVYLLVLFPLLPLVHGLSAFTVYLSAFKAGSFHRKSDLPLFLTLTSLPFLYLATLAFDKLIAYSFLVLSLVLLRRFLDTGFSLYLFLGGFLFGVTFFLDFSTTVVLPLLVLFFLTLRYELRRRISFLLVYLFPYAFFFLFYSFINYAFKNDAFYYLKEHVPNLSALLLVKATPTAVHALLFLLYLAGTVFVRKYRFLYFVPLAYLLLIFYANPVKELSDYGISLTFLLLLYAALTYDFSKSRARAFFVFFLLFTNLAFLFTDDRNERNFLRILTGGTYERNLALYRELGILLSSLKGNILLDDEALYPVVIYTENPSRLILPYRSEYHPYLLSLAGRVDYAVVRTLHRRDDLYGLYRESLRNLLNGCKYYGEVRDVKVFRCSDSPDYAYGN